MLLPHFHQGTLEIPATPWDGARNRGIMKPPATSNKTTKIPTRTHGFPPEALAFRPLPRPRAETEDLPALRAPEA